MKNISSLKSNQSDSPKTPGGISKSLLTPCRRIGLSRNWKKKGPSPFISPLADIGEGSTPKRETGESRKRKQKLVEDIPDTPKYSDVENVDKPYGNKTPGRDVEVPRRKKSKSLLSVINKSQEDSEQQSPVSNDLDINSEVVIVSNVKEFVENKLTDQVLTPVRSKSEAKKKSPAKSANEENSNSAIKEITSNFNNEIEVIDNLPEQTPIKVNEEIDTKAKLKSPNDLSKECIVVIQKKIFKKDLGKFQSEKVIVDLTPTPPNLKEEKPTSQVLFDSDSDNEPLVNKHKSKPTSDDEDFEPATKVKKPLNAKVNKKPKIANTKPHTAKGLRNLENSNTANLKETKEPKSSSQSSFDEDDDFETESKRTILIRKTYEKVTKPVKAKSTGSITQKDIDELKARIQIKKKILLAKAMTDDTKELRDLIKKWQKGCQDALMQLMDLMKYKMPDKNMDYSEMLEMLKIPANLVGYDEENDCFKTPDDAEIILANI